MISYLDEDDARVAADVIGFEQVEYIDRDGAQAYVFTRENDRVVACRGTEPNDWNDVKADANALTDLAETVGRVHRGFKREVDDLWPRIRPTLLDDGHRHWFAGHSLGGAMAVICANRCALADIPAQPEEVYTFGSPRVGNKRYVDHAEVTHVRWVNNNDIVTRVPPSFLRYRHRGDVMYLDSQGKPSKLTKRQMTKDRWRGFVDALRRRRVDHFSDHAIAAYVAHLAAATGSAEPSRDAE